ncbi:disease resistance protein RPV1-like isoform X3 [Mangifera indica]|uniref:disease resistance protein RPV1-like isoform X3 n=2 Tax=Mangifera indica TaxID=29780 RepID=UPI001CFBA683|nr:disease resistance protein RPV1-like isoform X3 [Mangifera indica]
MASSSLTGQGKYDVFLSFRGEDTRKNFTDHLYVALDQKGIFIVRDEEELERGTEISSELLKAIEESRISIVILSKSYASSTWCLDELEKIVECREMKDQKVFPVFYGVDPSEVRKQTGEIGKAFLKHEEDIDKGRIKRWRSALNKLGNISGYHLQDRHESHLIKKIVEEISEQLKQIGVLSRTFFGMEARVHKLINDYLQLGLDDIRFIGLWGMGGIGKTTTARVLYEMLSDQYEYSSFVANVREVSGSIGLVPLQEQLLSQVIKERNLRLSDYYQGVNLISNRLRRKRVFLVLDDVDQLEQLEALAGEREWFGSGSRIIITTRDQHLLVSHGVENIHIYKVEALDDIAAHKLFHSKAFKNTKPSAMHDALSLMFVRYALGLPLALIVLGSYLCNRSVEEWQSALGRVQEVPNEKIGKVLRISYDALNQIDKRIFLDISCFFNGKNKNRVMEKLDCFGFNPAIGIKELIDKSLLTIQNNELWMHDLVQQMGWEIVREQHHDNPGKWSRLWLSKDIYRVLRENMGTDAVEGMILDQPEVEITNLNGKCLSNMRNLRLLKISNVHISDDLEHLSNELRILKWHNYPLKSLPSSFYPENLCKLSMCYSHLEHLWNGIKAFEKLKIIKLSHSYNLIRAPDFTQILNLERLDVEGCKSLVEVHESIGLLRRLVLLNLKDCQSLVSLPSSVCSLESLKILNLYGCSKLEKLPQNLGKVKRLEELNLSGTAIREVPSSITLLTNLQKLSLRGCKGQQHRTWTFSIWSLLLPKRKQESMCLSLPNLIGLKSLTKLDLSNCNLLEGAIPSDLCFLVSLETLDLSGNHFISLPSRMNQLSKLRNLSVNNCQRLESLPELPFGIFFVGAQACIALKTLSSLPSSSTSANILSHFFSCSQMVADQGAWTDITLAVMFLKLRLQSGLAIRVMDTQI